MLAYRQSPNMGGVPEGNHQVQQSAPSTWNVVLTIAALAIGKELLRPRQD